MDERTSWSSLRERRMNEPGAEEAYEETRWAHELDAELSIRVSPRHDVA